MAVLTPCSCQNVQREKGFKLDSFLRGSSFISRFRGSISGEKIGRRRRNIPSCVCSPHPFLLCWGLCSLSPAVLASLSDLRRASSQLLLPYFVMFKPWAHILLTVLCPSSPMSFHEFRRPAIVGSAYAPSSQATAPASSLSWSFSPPQEALLIHHGCVQIHFLLSPLRAHCSFCHAPKVRFLFIML